MISMSRWFVGSSRIRKSAFCNIITASATRLASPPDSWPMRRSGASIWSEDNTCRISCSMLQPSQTSIAAVAASMRRRSPEATASSYSRTAAVRSSRREYTSSNTHLLGSNGVAWSKNATFILFMKRTSPPRSDDSTPARIFNSVLLPVPLGAISAILSPSFILNPMPEKSMRSP